jgi:hypothetical protein
MRLVEILQTAAPFLALFAALLTASERRLVDRLRRAGAVADASALALSDLRPLTRWRLARLRRGGAVRAADRERFYLDEAAYQALRRARRRRVLTIAALLAAALALLWLRQSAAGSP